MRGQTWKKFLLYVGTFISLTLGMILVGLGVSNKYGSIAILTTGVILLVLGVLWVIGLVADKWVTDRNRIVRYYGYCVKCQTHTMISIYDNDKDLCNRCDICNAIEDVIGGERGFREQFSKNVIKYIEV